MKACGYLKLADVAYVLCVSDALSLLAAPRIIELLHLTVNREDLNENESKKGREASGGKERKGKERGRKGMRGERSNSKGIDELLEIAILLVLIVRRAQTRIRVPSKP